MKPNEIREFFQSKYNSGRWKKLVSDLFPKSQFYKIPISKKDSGLDKHKDVKSIFDGSLGGIQNWPNMPTSSQSWKLLQK